jgi:homogentisate 1,2-dioxygenase
MPLDVVGWKGTLAPRQLNVRDIRPVLSRPLPPAAVGPHHLRDAQRGHLHVRCRARSRTAIPSALKVPFYHSNIDFDEVLFYHARRVLQPRRHRPGMATFHPQGIHHGPQPKAEASPRRASDPHRGGRGDDRHEGQEK